MNRIHRLLMAVMTGSALLFGAAVAQSPTVGLVMKSLANDFFKDMEDGAVAHEAERGDFRLVSLGIPNETDLDGQIALVENLIAQNVDAIVIAPADSRALVNVLARAVEQGIVVVNIDVKLDEEMLDAAGVNIPFVGPDNAAAARQVADVVAAEVGEGAPVIILEGIAGADNAFQRARGFREGAEAGGLEIVASRSANWETDQAFQLTTDLLTANPNVTAVLASNDSMAVGAVRALQSLGRDDVIVAGFDNIPAIRPMIEDGSVLASLDQFGAQQAAFGIDIALEMLEGEEYSGWVETPVEVITRESLQ